MKIQINETKEHILNASAPFLKVAFHSRRSSWEWICRMRKFVGQVWFGKDLISDCATKRLRKLKIEINATKSTVEHTWWMQPQTSRRPIRGNFDSFAIRKKTVQRIGIFITQPALYFHFYNSCVIYPVHTSHLSPPHPWFIREYGQHQCSRNTISRAKELNEFRI